MQSSGFFQLIPTLYVDAEHDQSQEPQSSESTLKRYARDIEQLKLDFLSDFGISVDRPLRRYPQLRCKPSFVFQYVHEYSSISQVEHLIADHETLFSEDYAVYGTNHEQMRQMRIPQPNKNQCLIHKLCMQFALDNLANPNVRTLFSNALQKLVPTGAEHPVEIANYASFLLQKWNMIPDGDSEAAELLSILQNGQPETGLTERTIFSFIGCFLSDYLTKYRNICAINDDPCTKPFSQQYTAHDWSEAKQYVERRADFESKRKDLADYWLSSQFPFDRQERFYSDSDDMVPSELSSDALEEMAEGIAQYLRSNRNKSAAVSRPLIKCIAGQLEQRNRYLFPIRMLILCVASGGTLFLKSSEIPNEKLFGFPESVFRKKPSVAIQHLERSRLLFTLCRASLSSADDIEQNILLFLRYHGAVLYSKEEVELWERFLSEYQLTKSAVSLPLDYCNALKLCLPLKVEELYCFTSHSALQSGGFAAFSKAFPDILSEYKLQNPNRRITIPKNLRDDYLAEWSKSCINLDELKRICSKIASKLDWTPLDQASEWFSQFIAGIPPNPIDIDELKILFAEITVRCYLFRQARQTLFNALTEAERGWRNKCCNRSGSRARPKS